MKARWATALGGVLIATLAAAQDDPTFKDQRERISYALGVEAATGFRDRAIDLDPDSFSKGVKDAFAGVGARLTDAQVHAAIAELRASVKQREIEGRKTRALERRKSAGAFLAGNATRDGVVTLPSGLQYEILKPGSGPVPTASDTVACRYRGTLSSGLEFDGSSRGGNSAVIKVDQAILGLREALVRMPVGSKWTIFVPPTLATGPRTATAVIPPNEILIYEVELLSIR